MSYYPPSPFVCKRCGLPVRAWGKPSTGETYWKHSSGGNSDRSCGRKPIPVPRAEWEKDARQLRDALDFGRKP